MVGPKKSERRGLIGLAVSTAVLLIGAYGWAEHYGWRTEQTPEIIVRSINLFVPNVDNLSDGNAFTRTAAVLGAVSTWTGVMVIWIALSGRSLELTWTRHFRRNHVVIVGEGEGARDIRDSASMRKLRWVQAIGQQAESQVAEGGVIAAVGYAAESLRRRTGLTRSAHVVVDLGEDVATLEAFGDIVRALDAAPARTCRSVAARVSDLELAASALDLVATRRAAASSLNCVPASCFDPSTEIARLLTRQARFFVRATARGQRRVHVLLVGFGEVAERVLDQVFLSCVAKDLDAPRVTIIDGAADRWRGRLAARRPGLHETSLLEWIQLDPDSGSIEEATADSSAARLLAVEREDPFSGLVIGTGDRAVVARTAHRLRELQLRQGILRAPVFLWHEAGKGFDFILATATCLADDAEQGVVPIGLPAEWLTEVAFGDAGRLKLAKDSHDAYLRHAAVTITNTSLQAISATMQRANLRAADHLPALLWSAGLGSGDGLIDTPERFASAQALLAEAPASPGARMLALAELEHARWCAERHLDGWRWGAVRDDRRRLHPLLVPFKALAQEEVAKDLDRVRASLAYATETYRGEEDARRPSSKSLKGKADSAESSRLCLSRRLRRS